MAWYPPPLAPGGTPHGAQGVCVTSDGKIVLVSEDGEQWGFPAGRPEPGPADGRLALEPEAQGDEERLGGLEVVDDDQDIVHPFERHVGSPSAAEPAGVPTGWRGPQREEPSVFRVA